MYWGCCFAFCVAFVDGMQSAGISLGVVTEICNKLPFYDLRWDGSYRQQLEPLWGCCRYGNITENERFYNLTE